MISWKDEIDIPKGEIKEINIELRKKSYTIYKDQDPQDPNGEEREDKEVTQEEYRKYHADLFSKEPDMIDESIAFFCSNSQLINFEIFKQLLDLTSIFQTELKLKEVRRTEMNLLTAIRNSITEYEYCDFFFENGYYGSIINIIRSVEDSVLIKLCLNILERISATSYQQSLKLFQSGLFDEFSGFFAIMNANSDSENFMYDHREIFDGIFNLLLVLLRHPGLFIDEDLLRIKFLRDIYKNIREQILENYYGNLNVLEISLALKFIRKIFVYIEFFGNQLESRYSYSKSKSKDKLIKYFNDSEIFEWIIKLLLIQGNEEGQENIQRHASKTIICIAVSYEDFSVALLQNKIFYNFICELNVKDKMNDNFKFGICRILRNFAACDTPLIVDSVFQKPNIMDFIKGQIEGKFSIKFEAFYTYFNLILLLKSKLKNYFLQNLDILPGIVDIIQFNDDSFFHAALQSIIEIIYMGETDANENVFVKEFNEAGLLQSLDMIDETEKVNEIARDMDEVRRLMSDGSHFNQLITKSEDEDIF